MLDLILAIAHHVLIFALFGVLVAEFILVRRTMDQAMAGRIAAIDLWYGILAGAIIVIGFSRAIFAAKGWNYYAHNIFFWAKIGTFAVIGILSVMPTLRYLRWRRENASRRSGDRRDARISVGATRAVSLAARLCRPDGARIWRMGRLSARPSPAPPEGPWRRSGRPASPAIRRWCRRAAHAARSPSSSPRW